MENNRTLNFYNQHAKEYADKTLDADMLKQQQAFVSYLPQNALILDLGCGAGRDSKAFQKADYRVIAVDGSLELCKIARSHLSCPVICSKFEDYNPTESFDGIWANSSLLHLEKNEIEKVLRKLLKNLKENGIFYLSFKYGTDCGFKNERFFQNMTEDSFQEIIHNIPGYELIMANIDIEKRENAEVKWLNIFLRKNK